MPIIHPKGSPSSRIWVVCEEPLSSDTAKGYLFSGGAGWVFDKMMADGGINDYYVITRRPDSDDKSSFRIVENDIKHYCPPFIITLGGSGAYLCDVLRPSKQQKTFKGQLGKYIGSLMSSPQVLQYPHYIMPIWDVEKYLQDWSERNVSAFFDMQKLRVEFEWWQKYGTLRPLPQRTMLYKDFNLDELIAHLERFRNSPLVSVDIETCYPKAESSFRPHPGYPITIGLADSPSFGISFNLFRSDAKESVILWQELNSLFKGVDILGQNFFNFDAHFLSMLGFEINLKRVKDTLIRHHVLWPELPHKLQFLTRQYTREPYYKDEGKQWNPKHMDSLRRYNCLDVCVTYEVYLEQEEEFKERGHLV